MTKEQLQAERVSVRESLRIKSDGFVLALCDATARHDSDWSMEASKRNRARRLTVYAVSEACERGIL